MIPIKDLVIGKKYKISFTPKEAEDNHLVQDFQNSIVKYEGINNNNQANFTILHTSNKAIRTRVGEKGYLTYNSSSAHLPVINYSEEPLTYGRLLELMKENSK